MQLYDLPIHANPAERLIHQGPENLNEIELLSILLSTKEDPERAVQRATALLKEHTLAQVLRFSVSQLETLPGMTAQAASLIVSARALCQLGKVSERSMITSASKVADMMTYLTPFNQEHVVALYMTSRNVLIEQKTVSIGTLASAPISARDVFAPAIVLKACGIILVHNHPSGDCQPSRNDISVTKNFIEVGKVLEVCFIDHVIVSKHGWKSMKQEKLMGW